MNFVGTIQSIAGTEEPEYRGAWKPDKLPESAATGNGQEGKK